MVPFVHPSIPDKIRKQLIRDTFAERIKAYCEDKQQAKEHLSAITDEMIDEFENIWNSFTRRNIAACVKRLGESRMMNWGLPLWTRCWCNEIAPFLSACLR